ncbi:MAG TPA: hypothetical protein VNQ78_07920 [Paracoccus sp. (in: a-proteobacteria)]|uniref:hypothetical protein n=1 Tax=Paracoccus sp. TaxID=267 RepID=UPI002CC9C55E|nr:hypothetical protein [Paracoccus sp. (in: a-proteobacteria)]HWL56589.1 hypothetical protein [Paracoccus sp. (in: a-proteobacteria)]
MTRENSDHDKDNPATNPERENGQGKHDGSSHKPEEFLKPDPESGKESSSRPQEAKPGTTMRR